MLTYEQIGKFVTDWDSKEKIDLIQVYLEADKSIIIYTETKQVVGKAYKRFDKLNYLDQLHN